MMVRKITKDYQLDSDNFAASNPSGEPEKRDALQSKVRSFIRKQKALKGITSATHKLRDRLVQAALVAEQLRGAAECIGTDVIPQSKKKADDELGELEALRGLISSASHQITISIASIQAASNCANTSLEIVDVLEREVCNLEKSLMLIDESLSALISNSLISEENKKLVNATLSDLIVMFETIMINLCSADAFIKKIKGWSLCNFFYKNSQ